MHKLVFLFFLTTIFVANVYSNEDFTRPSICKISLTKSCATQVVNDFNQVVWRGSCDSARNSRKRYTCNYDLRTSFEHVNGYYYDCSKNIENPAEKTLAFDSAMADALQLKQDSVCASVIIDSSAR